jgi:hypothetical protein
VGVTRLAAARVRVPPKKRRRDIDEACPDTTEETGGTCHGGIEFLPEIL